MQLETTETVNHWMVRSYGVGTTAEDLWESAKRYFMWCESNPIYKKELIKQTGAMVTTECPRPFNLPALCIHLGVSPSYILDIANRKEAGEYYLVAQRILSIIYAQKYENAVAGIFNPVLVGKDLSLGNGDEGTKVPAVINITVDNSGPDLLTNEQEIKI